jgi:tryptophanyl-tRNA synthetase
MGLKKERPKMTHSEVKNLIHLLTKNQNAEKVIEKQTSLIQILKESIEEKNYFICLLIEKMLEESEQQSLNILDHL